MAKSRRRVPRLSWVSAACATSLGLALELGAALAAPVACGDVVTTSITLTSHLGCPASSGLLVGANGITIDLGGYTLSGDHSPGGRGIDNAAGFAGVTVKNGTIRDFDTGIFFADAAGAEIRGVAVRAAATGIWLHCSVGSGPSGSVVDKTSVIASGHTGIFLDACSDVAIQSSLVVGSGTAAAFSGIAVAGASATVSKSTIAGSTGFGLHVTAPDALLKQNAITANGLDGIFLDTGADGTTVMNNKVEANLVNGIRNEAPGVTIRQNALSSNGGTGIVLGGGGTIAKNVVTASHLSGINLGSSAGPVTVTGNTTSRNGANGVVTTTAAATVGKNTAQANGAAGISLFDAASDAGGNKARDNAAEQCVNAACSPSAPAGGAGTTVTCGQLLTASVKLGNDLACTGPGLVVGAPGITIDLNGHTLSGDFSVSDYGIDNSGGHDRVTVLNGTITGFGRGMSFFDAAGGKISRIVARENVDGIWLEQCAGAGATKVDKSAATFNAGSGIVLTGCPDVTIQSTSVVKNGSAGTFAGIYGDGAHRLRVSKSTIVGNTDDGIHIASSTGAVVQQTTVSQNGAVGIRLADSSSEATITKNVVEGGQGGIAVLGGASVASGNLVVGHKIGITVGVAASGDALIKNTVVGNGTAGIFVDPNAVSTAVTGNTALRNAGNGIQVGGATSTVGKNVAQANSATGIDADGTIDGGGNKARDNGADCIGVVCP